MPMMAMGVLELPGVSVCGAALGVIYEN